MSDIGYRRYQELGGSISKHDYHDVLAKAGQTTSLGERLVAQAELVARVAKVPLDNSEGHLDEITILYGVLRTDLNPGTRYFQSQMCDQRLFAEVLKMLGHSDWLEKVINAYPNICFV